MPVAADGWRGTRAGLREIDLRKSRKYSAAHREKERVRSSRYYHENPERGRAIVRAFRIRNPERSRAIDRATQLKTQYGVTVATYDAMLERQCGVCGCLRNLFASGNGARLWEAQTACRGS